MARWKQSRRVTRRQSAVAFAALLWVVVVAAGAGSDADDSLLGVDNLDVVWIVVFLIAILMSLWLLILLNPFNSEWIAPEKKKRGIAAQIVGLLVIVLTVFVVNRLGITSNEEDEEAQGGVNSGSGEEEIPFETPVETVAQATDILLLLVGLAAVAGVWFFLRGRTGQDADSLDDQAATALEIDLVQALDRAAHELDASGDPRTAVLRSYAVLEAVLSSHGLARATAETATEHLQRATANLRIDAAPVAQLGGLYEIARFSERPIAKPQQDDAIAALRQAQASLAALA